MKWQRSRGRAASARAAAVGAVVCVLAALPVQAGADSGPSPYVFDPGAKRISGAATTSGAKQLDADGTYRDSIEPGGTRIYRLNLDARTNAYVSAVAVPGAASTVAYGDKIEISLQNSQGSDCSSNDAQFGTASKYPRPLAAYAYRLVEKGAYSCQEAGPYYVVIERTGEDSSTPEPWELEIRHVSEPELTSPGPSEAPSGWPSASPEPVGGESRARAGGTGFYDAAELGKGEWTAEIEPGASLFYRVPVDWGQQIFAGADLGSAAGTGSGSGSGFVSGAFSMALYNPARGLVDTSNSLSYNGKQKTTALDALPPVAYENRFGSRTGDKEMRFAGWYYLRVSLSPEVGKEFGPGPYGLTLRVDVTGDPQGAPAYAGPAGDFSVDPDDRQASTGGDTSRTAAAADNGTMTLVAAGGIGMGTVLVAGLGVWTLLARRRAAPGPG
ncbi:hypothetical protein [Streptomyces sp. NPDC088182]|uniref:hypothetical protein n=1 Tax=Streptomyces sp. NPDC088182 TaxID=3365838 RepID=UPI00382701B7